MGRKSDGDERTADVMDGMGSDGMGDTGVGRHGGSDRIRKAERMRARREEELEGKNAPKARLGRISRM